MTLRWREMDSKFQCRDASPAPKAWAPSFGGESQLLKSPKRLYRLAESDDSSDYTTAPTVDRPQFDRSLECARNRKFEFSFFQERFMRTFGFPSGNRRGPPSILRNGKSHSMQIVIIGPLILVVQRIFRQRLVV